MIVCDHDRRIADDRRGVCPYDRRRSRNLFAIRDLLRETAWPSGESVGFEIRRSWVQIPFWPLAGVVLSSLEFNLSSTLVNSQLVCLPPVGILNLVMFIWILIYHCLFTLVLKSSDAPTCMPPNRKTTKTISSHCFKVLNEQRLSKNLQKTRRCWGRHSELLSHREETASSNWHD